MPDEKAPRVLEYAATRASARAWPQRVFVLFAVVAAATPFLDFASGISPLDCLRNPRFSDLIFTGGLLTWVGAAFFTSIPILIWKVWNLTSARCSRRRERIWMAVAAVFWVPTVVTAWAVVSAIVQSLRDNAANAAGWWVQIISLALPTIGVPIAGIWYFARQWIRDRASAIEAAFVTPYVSNGLFCVVAYGLLMYFTSPQIGCWMTAIAASGLGVELILIGCCRRRAGACD